MWPWNGFFYFTRGLIDDHHPLVTLITETLDEMLNTDLCHLLLDKVTYICSGITDQFGQRGRAFEITPFVGHGVLRSPFISA